MTTICRTCEEVLDSINWAPHRKRKLNKVCKKCDAEDLRLRRIAKRKYVADYKSSQGCLNCGYNESPVALQLAHKERGTKTKWNGSKGRAWCQDWSISRIDQEIALCDVLCANCHAIETHRENNDTN